MPPLPPPLRPHQQPPVYSRHESVRHYRALPLDSGVETGGTYRSRLHTVFADDDWAVAIYRATGSRNAIDLDVDQALVIRIADGLWQDVTAVPLDSALECRPRWRALREEARAARDAAAASAAAMKNKAG